MFRLTVILCLGLYGAMLIGGQDYGQQRFGLMQAKADRADALAVVEPAATPLPEPVVATVSYVPEKPLMAPEATLAVSEAVSAPTAPAPDPAPVGRVQYIATDSANVREGPGKDHAVLERLPYGEAVLVLVEGEGPDGWSLIRIEGDGVEGYIASRLLAD